MKPCFETSERITKRNIYTLTLSANSNRMLGTDFSRRLDGRCFVPFFNNTAQIYSLIFDSASIFLENLSVLT